MLSILLYYFILLYRSIVFESNVYNIIQSKNKLLFKYNELPYKFVNMILANNNKWLVYVIVIINQEKKNGLITEIKLLRFSLIAFIVFLFSTSSIIFLLSFFFLVKTI